MTAKGWSFGYGYLQGGQSIRLFISQSTKALQRIYATYGNSYGPI